jgi:hypothetical protein
MDGRVLCLASGGGDLVAGGEFHRAGSAPAERIARWDGEGWAALGRGLDGRALAVAFHEGAWIVGGEFQRAGDAAASNVARWHGGAWTPLGAGTDGPVLALEVLGGDLIAAGEFQRAGSAATGGIARWDGTEWLSLGASPNGAVTDLLVRDGVLVAAGHFTRIGDVDAPYLANWDAACWQPLAPGVDAPALALAEYREDWTGGVGEPAGMAVGGLFRAADGTPSERIALWTGTRGRAQAAPDEATGGGLELVASPSVAAASTGPIRLGYRLPSPARVRLTVHDLEGRRLATLIDGWEGAGSRERSWAPAGPAGAGVYFLRLHAGDDRRTVRVVRLD